MRWLFGSGWGRSFLVAWFVWFWWANVFEPEESHWWWNEQWWVYDRDGRVIVLGLLFPPVALLTCLWIRNGFRRDSAKRLKGGAASDPQGPPLSRARVTTNVEKPLSAKKPNPTETLTASAKDSVLDLSDEAIKKRAAAARAWDAEHDLSDCPAKGWELVQNGKVWAASGDGLSLEEHQSKLTQILSERDERDPRSLMEHHAKLFQLLFERAADRKDLQERVTRALAFLPAEDRAAGVAWLQYLETPPEARTGRPTVDGKPVPVSVVNAMAKWLFEPRL